MLTTTTKLLDVRNLRLTTARQLALVDDLSFSIERACVTALVGESGSGKTLAARSILRLLPPGIHLSGGNVLLDGENLTLATDARMRELRGPAIGMVFQEPMVSLNPAMTIGAQMAEALRLHERLSRSEARERCIEMLKRVDIKDPQRRLESYPHEFSGGMRQRIMLASVMMLRPKLLIADEPTTALDTLAQRDVLDLMSSLAADFGTAVLLITHNLGLVARYARDAIVLQRGRLIEAGPAARLLSNPRETYTRDLVNALPRRPARKGGELSIKHRAAQADTPLLSIRELGVTYKRQHGLLNRSAGTEVLARIDLDLFPGETVALVGGSGSGKTTLGRAILGLAPLSAGTVRFKGRDVTTLDASGRREFRLSCQLIFQDPYSSLDPRMRVGDIVAEPLRHCPDLDQTQRRARAIDTLDEVGLAGYGDRFPHELSGGQRQRIAIARAIVRRPAMVVADEPVSALDSTVQNQVLTLFKSLQEKHHFACLFISHDFAAVAQISDRIIVLERGVIVESGQRDEILDQPRHEYTRALLDASPRLNRSATPAMATALLAAE